MLGFTKKLSNKTGHFLRDSSGFSLLELTIAVLLLAAVISIGFTFYFFSVLSFGVGEKQVDVQQNARIVANFLSEELRIAERIIIIDEYTGDLKELDFQALKDDMGIDIDDPADDPANRFYVYFIFLRDNSIYYQEVDGTDQPAVLLEGISQKVDFDLAFKKSEEKDNLLRFDVSATNKDDGRTYHLDSEVLALNLDNIEDELLSSDEGTAIVYQVPAPFPSIRGVTLQPSEIISYGTFDLDIKVITNEVSDGRIVTPEVRKINQDGPSSPVAGVIYDPAEPEVLNDESEFRITLPATAYFGDYYVLINVDSVSFPRYRIFYLLPVIHDDQPIKPRPGVPHYGEVTIETSGVEEDTEVVKTTDPDPEGDQLFISFIRRTIPQGEDFDPSNEDHFEHVEFSIDPEAPAIDADGKATFLIHSEALTDYPYEDFYLRAKIGRIDWQLIGQPFNPYLFDLEVSYMNGASIDFVDAEGAYIDFDPETLDYTVNLVEGTEEVLVNATLQDERSSMTINGVDTTSGDDYKVENLENDMVISIVVTAGDGESKEYSITIKLEDPEDPEAPFLSNLEVNYGVHHTPLNLDPSFDKEVYGYEVSVEADLESVRVTATFDDGSVSINDHHDVTSGAHINIDFSGEEKDILVIISADGGVTTREYTITVKPE